MFYKIPARNNFILCLFFFVLMVLEIDFKVVVKFWFFNFVDIYKAMFSELWK